MPRISQEQKQYYKSRIRSVLAQSPAITQVALQARLKADGLDLDRWYLASLLKSIQAERVKRLDTLTLNYALSSFQDVMMEISAVAWEIANDEFARKQDRVMALREIREAHNLIFEKLFDAGVFERKLGTLDATIRNTPLPDERKQAIRSVFENWGLLPAPKEDAGTPQPTPETPA
jgi:arginine repressor